MLDGRFFQRTSKTATKHGYHLESYKAVYARSTMVLFSRKTATPLAALTLKTDDVGCLSMLTGRPSPTNSPAPYFQGMISMPEQAFSFTITNLSDQGMINFNILNTPHRVSEVDPGPSFGVNEVNELHKNQSYTIEADQRNNCRMILSGKTKTVENPVTKEKNQVAVTVDESEQEKNPAGLYFWLSVVPDNACVDLVGKFTEGTAWKVTPGFVRPVDSRSAANESRAVPEFPASWLEESELLFRGSGSNPHLHRFLEGSAQHDGGDGGSVPPEPAGRAPQIGEVLDIIDLVVMPEGGGQKKEGIYMTKVQHQKADRLAEQRSSTRQLQKQLCGTKRLAEPVNVGQTQAAGLKYGSRVDVRSGFTGHDYAYEHASEPTVLCMSIWEGMRFLPLPDINKDLELEVEDMIQSEGKRSIQSLNGVYKADTCVIDLESEKADTIICSCGHMCIHHANIDKNLRRCPMCRSPITAFVRADGILLK